MQSRAQEQFQNLIKHEDNLLEAIRKIDDPKQAETLMELLILTAVYDGKIDETEISILGKIAQALNLDLDIAAIQQKAVEYRIDYSNKNWQKIAEATETALGSAKNTASQLFSPATEKVKKGFQRLFGKNSTAPAE